MSNDDKKNVDDVANVLSGIFKDKQSQLVNNN